MSVPWNSTLRENQWSSWQCSIDGAAASCPSGYKPDTSQRRAAGDCADGNKGNSGGCPNNCKGDTRSVCAPSWLGGGCSYTPLYDRYSVECFKNNYSTDNNTLWGCCSGTTPAQNCDPSYYKDSSSCNSFLSTNCTGSILTNTSDPKYATCNTWYNNNKSQGNSILASYCNNASNLGNSVCQQYALANGGIDNAVQQYCQTHTSDAFCSCQNPLTNYTGSDPHMQILNNPICFGAQCPINGYKTTNQRDFKCPTSINICNNSISTSGKTATYLSSLENSCSTSSATASNSATSDASGSTTTKPSTSTAISGFSIKNLSVGKQLLLLFVLLLSIIFGIRFIMSKEETNKSPNTVNVLF